MDVVNITINTVVDTLVELGIIVPLSGDSGYNGITKPEGVSNQIISDAIHDNLLQALSRASADLVSSNLGQFADD